MLPEEHLLLHALEQIGRLQGVDVASMQFHPLQAGLNLLYLVKLHRVIGIEAHGNTSDR